MGYEIRLRMPSLFKTLRKGVEEKEKSFNIT
jgi:hypothetical protein